MLVIRFPKRTSVNTKTQAQQFPKRDFRIYGAKYPVRISTYLCAVYERQLANELLQHRQISGPVTQAPTPPASGVKMRCPYSIHTLNS